VRRTLGIGRCSRQPVAAEHRAKNEGVILRQPDGLAARNLRAPELARIEVAGIGGIDDRLAVRRWRERLDLIRGGRRLSCISDMLC